ncbi:hypothetical protein [Micromonospora sp. WMMD712]|uniref:hypothetical protein n=1 Tax=Micromonospora sp. WMMD712 TaxID=3016096 RepID=UPI00249CB353|nr:hypothetical protein [Micromonospora sp. WMMD712]WFE60045.1 hypothetical protein O7633_25785 [Micromonospora sp. WMMD712]
MLDIIESRLLISNNSSTIDGLQQNIQVSDSIVEIRAAMSDSYTVGQAGAVGRYAKAEQVNFQQIWDGAASGIDVDELSAQLKDLRAHLRKEADTAEHDESVAEVSKAQLAASAGDGPRAMTHLRQAGKWALSGATAIGTTVAAAAIKAALGI